MIGGNLIKKLGSKVLGFAVPAIVTFFSEKILDRVTSFFARKSEKDVVEKLEKAESKEERESAAKDVAKNL